MQIGIICETTPHEQRVAVVPDTVKQLLSMGYRVHIESGAGLGAKISDHAFAQAGATIHTQKSNLFDQINILLKINLSTLHEINLLKSESILIAPLATKQCTDVINQLQSKKITAFALDLIPRIARAQPMDILSSMANLAGYKSVILAANHLEKMLPMMMTAAGTIFPAKVMVIGAGVAGLQAMATAKRLGAVVYGLDTRVIVADQVKSVGAEFIALTVGEEQTTLSQHFPEMDIVICTAQILGKPAPVLISADLVKTMKHGSVIVDLAAEQGGNCALTVCGKTINQCGVTIIGALNLPSTLPLQASQLFAKNCLAFINYLTPQIAVKQFDMDDEIIKACLITGNGT